MSDITEAKEGLELYEHVPEQHKTETAHAANNDLANHNADNEYVPPTLATYDDQDIKHKLSWRSWGAILACMVGVVTQTLLTVGPAAIIAFIAQEMGGTNIAWIIQAPLLVQTALSPLFGRLSDLKGRKWIAIGGPFLAAIGCIVCARATTMNMLIGGSVLIGFSLPTVSIVQSIPVEVLPLKWRSISNGMAFFAANIGATIGQVGGGAFAEYVTWRWIFWLQGIFHLLTIAALFFFYNPTREYVNIPFRDLVWAADAIGTLLFTIGATLTLIALTWADSAYPWSDAHVVAFLVIGIVFLLVFAAYEYKGRTDGLVPHSLFKDGNNFALSVIALSGEGWVFFGLVSQYTNQVVLNVGFGTEALYIGVRQTYTYAPATALGCLLVVFWATKYKDFKVPLLATFLIFLVVMIAYGFLTPGWNKAQIGLNVLTGIGTSGPLTLLLALCQYSAPHAFLATATGLALSARAVGGAFGSAIITTIINGKLSNRNADIAAAALANGLPSTSVPILVEFMEVGAPLVAVPGVTPQVIAAVTAVSRTAYAHAYRYAYLSTIPIVVISIICIIFIKSVSHAMNEHIEATAEKKTFIKEEGVAKA